LKKQFGKKCRFSSGIKEKQKALKQERESERERARERERRKRGDHKSPLLPQTPPIIGNLTPPLLPDRECVVSAG
jgi:hypothetical protein